MKYLLYLNQNQLEDSIIKIAYWTNKKYYEENDSRHDNCKGYKGGLLFDNVKELKKCLRIERDDWYAWNGNNLFTPKTEVTSWINSLNKNSIAQQEFSRLEIENEELSEELDESKFLLNHLKVTLGDEVFKGLNRLYNHSKDLENKRKNKTEVTEEDRDKIKRLRQEINNSLEKVK
tara:strand:- start:230 stop:757 length:528 start_codon:yes stop_codon:yes gene_type:complete